MQKISNRHQNDFKLNVASCFIYDFTALRKLCRNTGFLWPVISSVIRQKGESQNGCHKKTKQVKFSNKWTFLTPVVRTRSLQKIWRDMVCLGRRGSVLVKPTIISFSHIKKFAISCNLPQKKNCIGAPMCKITMCKICSKLLRLRLRLRLHN